MEHLIAPNRDHALASHLCSSAEALWVEVGENLQADVSREKSSEVCGSGRHEWVEQVVDGDQFGIPQMLQEILHESPSL